MIKLVEPNGKYAKEIEDAKKEILALGQNNESDQWYLDMTDVNEYVQKKKDEHNGVNLREGWVPGTTFWIVDEKDSYIGRISLRHKLAGNLEYYAGHIGYDIRPSARGKGYATTALALCLNEARKLNLKKVLLTCDDNNKGSKKVIEKNGGVFQDKIDNKQDNGELTMRYWITL